MDRENKLIAAVQQGDIELVRQAIDEGADVNERDQQGWTPLHWSAGSGNVEIIRFLLNHWSDVTLAGRDNRTPLMVARSVGRTEVVAVLTEAEKARGVWQDPRESRPYCKGYYLKDLHDYPHWTASQEVSQNGHESAAGTDPIVYIQRDFTVTKSVWPREGVIFKAVTPEWINFCESQLKFSIPSDLC